MMQTRRIPRTGQRHALGAIRHWLPLLLLLAAMAVPPGARAEEPSVRQLANLIFAPPPCWKFIGRRAADGRLEINYDGDRDRCRKCQIVIDRGNSTAMSIRAWQEALSRAVFEAPRRPAPTNGTGRPMAPTNPYPDARGEGRPRPELVPGVLRGGPVHRHELLAFTAEVSSQAELDGAAAVINAGVLPMHYFDGRTATLQIMNDGAIHSGRVTMYPKKVPPAGYRFAGTIHSVSYTSFGLTGGVPSERN
ncbi:hypothetical protein [Geminicoccus flavidas]|uniref:hypothetical protein n=1 Tax=Geminicoccus flavidas TaxID=2506407 RepID=UPI00135967B3|nr:hypothetical protein [Geminicoccus flavidas]